MDVTMNFTGWGGVSQWTLSGQRIGVGGVVVGWLSWGKLVDGLGFGARGVVFGWGNRCVLLVLVILWLRLILLLLLLQTVLVAYQIQINLFPPIITVTLSFPPIPTLHSPTGLPSFPCSFTNGSHNHPIPTCHLWLLISLSIDLLWPVTGFMIVA